MKVPLKAAFAATIASAAMLASGGPFSATPSTSASKGKSPFSASSADSVFQDPASPSSTWSGSKAELEAIVAQAKANYGFEDSKHLGRDATELKPANLHEMLKEISTFGNEAGWEPTPWDGAHAPDAKSDDGIASMTMNSSAVRGPQGIVKFINKQGGEAVYDLTTGKIVMNEKMGTHNFDTQNSAGSSVLPWGGHRTKDMNPHAAKASPSNQFEKDGDQYKYVGILYERDPNDPNKFFLVDGQTGKRLTKQQAKEFPTTLSDMWKDQGLTCVANDAKDFEQTPTPTINTAAAMDPFPGQLVQTPSGTVNPAAALQTQTIDNSAMKAQMSALLENAYQYASGIAAEGGVGAEYQSAVAPVLSQGRAAISAIPDRQTVAVPAGSAQGGGYSSETMDAVGKAFAEQGPCSAGLLLQSLQNQNKR